MKRDNFIITSIVGHSIVKHTWNSANRTVEALAKELASDEDTIYRLTASESVKEGFYHVSGHRVWTSDKSGLAVVFTITKE